MTTLQQTRFVCVTHSDVDIKQMYVLVQKSPPVPGSGHYASVHLCHDGAIKGAHWF